MANVTTRRQESAGGVVYRQRGGETDVALIAVAAGAEQRWQLPKGLIGANEEPEQAALREVQEETGLRAEIVAPLETVEYWYHGRGQGSRVRFHKYVYFYLMRYLEGNTADHDHEVAEARWVPLGEAARMLAFKSERKLVEQAAALLQIGSPPGLADDRG
jgi:8-oxo-dGTP pyrophosphatase MutT (NUDIX family)